MLRLWRRYDRELVCARCRNVIAWIHLTPFSLPQVTTRSGARLASTGADVLSAALRTRLLDVRSAAGSGPGSAPGAAREIEVLQRLLRYVQDPDARTFYELTCPDCGTHYLRSMPDVAASVRNAAHGRVLLE